MPQGDKRNLIFVSKILNALALNSTTKIPFLRDYIISKRPMLTSFINELVVIKLHKCDECCFI